MTAATLTKDYCNCLALERGLDPVGHAGTFDDAIIIETALPWKLEMTETAGQLPQEMLDLRALWLKDYYDGKGYPHLPLVIAPDSGYSREGFRRVMFYTRPAGGFAQFEKVEYLVRVDQLGSLVWSLYQARAALPGFEPYRVPGAENIRDILVCTHGTIDAACAKFGFPIFKQMRQTSANEQLRVWRVSHFGGHVFAPTLMEMPSGHYWAYVGQEQAAQIVARDGDPTALRGYYRGWAGVADGFEQTAEAALWQQIGWDWFNYRKQSEIVARSGDSDRAKWADVRITYAPPTAATETSVTLRVEMSHQVETPHSTGETSSYAYPQYRVVEVIPSKNQEKY